MNIGRRESYDLEKLLAYAAGDLTAPEFEAIERILARDRTAREIVATYRSVIMTVASDQSAQPPAHALEAAKAIFDPNAIRRGARGGLDWTSSLRQIVATLVFDSRVQPALAGYRGGSSGFELGFASDAGEIDLQAEPVRDERPTPSGATRWRIIGQVSPNEETGDQPMPEVGVALVKRDEAKPARAIDADEHGVFTIQADAGDYDLHVRIGDAVVVIQDVRIE
jgi:hypothetical protein